MSNFVIVIGPVNEVLPDHSVKLMADRVEKAMNNIYKHTYDIERKHDTLFVGLKQEVEDADKG